VAQRDGGIIGAGGGGCGHDERGAGRHTADIGAGERNKEGCRAFEGIANIWDPPASHLHYTWTAYR